MNKYLNYILQGLAIIVVIWALSIVYTNDDKEEIILPNGRIDVFEGPNEGATTVWHKDKPMIYVKQYTDGKIKISEPEICSPKQVSNKQNLGCIKVWSDLQEGEKLIVLMSTYEEVCNSSMGCTLEW